METDEKKVVSIMSFNSVMEAQLYKALLESAGVTARLQNDIATQIYPPIGMLLPVNILVAEEDQVRAREILGAKFDLDDFHRQSNPQKPAGKPRAKTTSDKSAAAKKSPAKKSPAKKAAAKKSDTAKASDMKGLSSKSATVKSASAKKTTAKKTTAKKTTEEC